MSSVARHRNIFTLGGSLSDQLIDDTFFFIYVNYVEIYIFIYFGMYVFYSVFMLAHFIYIRLRSYILDIIGSRMLFVKA